MQEPRVGDQEMKAMTWCFMSYGHDPTMRRSVGSPLKGLYEKEM